MNERETLWVISRLERLVGLRILLISDAHLCMVSIFVFLMNKWVAITHRIF